MVYSLKRLISLIIVFVLILTIAAPALAATFFAYILVTEGSGTSYDMLPMSDNIDVQYLADNGYITANGTDARVVIGSTEYARMLHEDALLFAAPVSANSSTQYQMTTGNSAEVFDILTGYGGYVTVTDNNTSLEPGDNFTAQYSGWVDTSITGAVSSNQTIIRKPGALYLYPDSGNITASLAATASDELQYSDDTERDTTSAAYVKITEITVAEAITTARVKFDIKVTGGTGYGRIYKSGVAIGTEQTTVGVGYTTKSEDITLTALPGDTIELWGKNSAGPAEHTYYKNFRIYFTIVSVTATTASGDYDIELAMESPFLSLGIDATSPITPVAANITANMPVWQLEEYAAPGGTFTTIDNNAYTITVTNATHTENSGYTFNGINARLSGTITDAPQGSANVTIEMVIIPTADVANKYVFLYGTPGGAGQMSAIIQNAGGIVTWGWWGNDFSTPAGALTIGAPNHIICTWDGTTRTIEVKNAAGTTTASDTPAAPAWNGTTAYWAFDAGATYWAGTIIDFRMYAKEFSAAERLQNYNSFKSKFLTGDIYTHSTLLAVPNNANDYVIMSDATPYMDYFKLYIDGVLECWFQPQTIVNGTFLPDRAVGNSGIITWGSNLAGIGVTIGALTLTDAPVSSGLQLTTPDAVGIIGETSPIHLENYQLVGGAHEFAPIVDDVATLSNIPASMIWAFIAVLLAILALAMVRKYMDSAFPSGFAFAAVFALFAAIGSEQGLAAGIEWWQPAAVGLATLATAIMQRSSSI